MCFRVYVWLVYVRVWFFSMRLFKFHVWFVRLIYVHFRMHMYIFMWFIFMWLVHVDISLRKANITMQVYVGICVYISLYISMHMWLLNVNVGARLLEVDLFGHRNSTMGSTMTMGSTVMNVCLWALRVVY